jgi:hypothetical protein
MGNGVFFLMPCSPLDRSSAWIIQNAVCRSGILPLFAIMGQDAAFTGFMTHPG